MPPFKLRPGQLTAVDILCYIQAHQAEFPNLKRLSPAQVLARMPTKDERYQLGEEGLREILRGILPKQKHRRTS